MVVFLQGDRQPMGQIIKKRLDQGITSALSGKSCQIHIKNSKATITNKSTVNSS